MKQLSIIIPTYNMEKYLYRCLNSLLIKEHFNLLEVWVVNDGSKDRSSSIAHEYAEKYPEVFHVIDKPNGNYGSCINAALKIASGKYVKVLDADDWFDTKDFLIYLKRLQAVDTDVILTNFTNVYSSGHKKNWNYPLEDSKIYSSTILSTPSFKYMAMHAITYRMELLRGCNYIQTERISYTDQEWIFYPMRYVTSLYFMDLHVYQYLIGRQGQTMDTKIMLKNISHFVVIAKRMVLSYQKWLSDNLDEAKKIYLQTILMNNLIGIYKKFLMYGDRGSLNTLDEFDLFIKDNVPNIYKYLDKVVLHKNLPYHFILHYHRMYKQPNFFIRYIFKNLKSIQTFFEYRLN